MKLREAYERWMRCRGRLRVAQSAEIVSFDVLKHLWEMASAEDIDRAGLPAVGIRDLRKVLQDEFVERITRRMVKGKTP